MPHWWSGPAAGDVPGRLLDLSRWYLTLPVADRRDATHTWDVYAPDLATFRHERFAVRDGAVEYVAPVRGVTTSAASGATRCELREMAGPRRRDKAAWTFDAGPRTLTCTLSCDPTTASPRRECIVGQIHDEDASPPIHLAVDLNREPGTLRLFARGHRSTALLDGLGRDTVVTYRIRVADRRCAIWAARGGVDALAPEPSAVFGVDELRTRSGVAVGRCYFKAGAYNKSRIGDDGAGGRSVVRHLRLELA